MKYLGSKEIETKRLILKTNYKRTKKIMGNLNET